MGFHFFFNYKIRKKNSIKSKIHEIIVHRVLNILKKVIHLNLLKKKVYRFMILNEKVFIPALFVYCGQRCEVFPSDQTVSGRLVVCD